MLAQTASRNGVQSTGDQHVGPATDIYALGCVLYEMLVGEPPYTGSTPQAVLGKIITGTPEPVKQHRKTVPGNVEATIRRALEKVPADRFASAQEFGKALSDPGFRHGEEALAGVAGVGPSNRLTVIGWGVAALFALTFGWSLLRSTPEPPRPVARFVPILEGQVFNSGFELTRDGSAVVYVGSIASEGGNQLWIRNWSDLDARPIRGTTGAFSGALSPDGREVAFIVGNTGSLRVVPLAGGPSRTLAESAVQTFWSPDGWIYFASLERLTISRVLATGGPIETVTELSEGESIHAFAQTLPSGDALLFQVWHAVDGSDAEIRSIDLETGEQKTLTAGNAPRYAASHLLFGTTDGTLMAAPFDANRVELTGNAVPIAEGLSTDPVTGFIMYSVSEDGSLVYLTGGVAVGERRLVVVDLEGNERTLTLTPRNFGEVAWSPDGRSVVYASGGDIYTYNVELGTTPRQLTFNGRNIRPVFSADGARVAFSSTRDGTDRLDLFVKTLGDDAPARSLITLDGNEYATQWPSDTLIVFEQAPNPSDLWILDLSDPDSPRAEVYLPLEADLDDIVVSRDGALAAYGSNETGRDEVYIRSFPEQANGHRCRRAEGNTPSGLRTAIPSTTGPQQPLVEKPSWPLASSEIQRRSCCPGTPCSPGTTSGRYRTCIPMATGWWYLRMSRQSRTWGEVLQSHRDSSSSRTSSRSFASAWAATSGPRHPPERSPPGPLPHRS